MNTPMTATQLALLAGCVLMLLLAGAKLDMDDAMAKCQQRHTAETCRAQLWR